MTLSRAIIVAGLAAATILIPLTGGRTARAQANQYSVHPSTAPSPRIIMPSRQAGNAFPIVTDDIADSTIASGGLTSPWLKRLRQREPFQGETEQTATSWSFQHMPDGLLYRSYLAGPRESRIGSAWLANSDGPDAWDITLGGRVGILRWGTDHPQSPEGWQLDIEGAAFPRLNLDEDADVDATDFRFGIPLTWRRGRWQTKAAYYHLSSHAGDEFIERNPMFQRTNFSRNAIVLGIGWFATPDLRLYAEADYGFADDGGAEPWWFQFGFDYAPSQPTGLRGAPFVAANGFLREEADFGGTFTLMAGWAWRADRSGHLCRIGLQYSNGHTTQLEFQQESEQLIGLGVWYDY